MVAGSRPFNQVSIIDGFVKKSQQVSLRGAERRGNLGFSSAYTRRDCFTSFAMTTFLTFYGTINY